MVKVIYRWKVQKADESKFKAAWGKATTLIRNSTPGARGSVLIQSFRDPTEFVTIARWEKIENWRSFWEASTRVEMNVMHSLAECLSVEAYEEIEDRTV